VRTIVHLSDLHFGATLFSSLEPLIEAVTEVRPDLVIVSGDLTQRARATQFRDARRFLDRLPQPQLVVPGNHDVPLYDVVRRFLAPLRRYRAWINPDPEPVYIDDEIAVVGVNSARSLVLKGGAISARQRDVVARQFAAANRGQVRILVAHHPFDVPPSLSGIDRVDGATDTLVRLADLRVDLVLAGHLHMIHEACASRYVPGYRAMLLHAGTATSTRSRGEPNSFFVIRTDDRITIETWKWNAGRHCFEATGVRYPDRISRPHAVSPFLVSGGTVDRR
jgi:3',5'-cyclic AMP phosphodiesterase CpdA